MDSPAESGHAPSESPAQPPHPDDTRPSDIPYPAFCKVIFIFDPILGALRALLIGLELIRTSFDALTGVWLGDAVAGLLVLVFGTPASVVMLSKKRWGIGPAGIALLAALYSIGLGVWQVASQIALEMPAETGAGPRMSFIVGSGCVVVCRIVLVILYGMAILRFVKWSQPHGRGIDKSGLR